MPDEHDKPADAPKAQMPLHKETHLGDGLYASWNGDAIWLRAPRPGGDHSVALSVETFMAFQRWSQPLADMIRKVGGGG
jgi:hypothetical protein